MALFSGLLLACSPSSTLQLIRNESTPPYSSGKTDRANTHGAIGAPVALPPRFDNEPLKPGQVKSALMPNGLPALSPMKGINYNTLFAEKIKDKDERFDRVENVVFDLRKEFETYKPAIVRLAAVESDIQGLIKELEVLLQETPSRQPPSALAGGASVEDYQTKDQNAVLEARSLNSQPASPLRLNDVDAEVAQAAPRLLAHPNQQSGAPLQLQPQFKNEKKIQQQSEFQQAPMVPIASKEPLKTTSSLSLAKDDNGKIYARNFRMGEHDGMLRIAFDMNESTPFTIELDNEEHLIIIELPQAIWDGKRHQSFPDSALLESLNVEPTNGERGSMVILSLKKDTRLLQRKHLSPDKTSEYHRVFFDLRR